jgi:hypothetical protein
MKIHVMVNLVKNFVQARCQWLMPVILATLETDQEDQGLKPAGANSLQDPILKKTHRTKKGW